MNRTIQKEILIPQPRAQVWQAITDSAVLAEWMFPNDFQPRVGHAFTFRVPGNPKANFNGLTVRCQVLECEPPAEGAAGTDVGGRLVFSWSAGGPVENTQVSFRLMPDGDGTRLLFEHAGFDLSQPFGPQAFAGAEFGWTRMLQQLVVVVERPAKSGNP
ncbi:SRPBCC family protein [Humisphaera borealis]|uniref:SRPBCC domain-containing protein n=1 Tax=Humisphaera borealis TaxID=2807512 RepID=A0A7M2X0E2_9BACT|nr:SRPBCC domain-containing protein [Humisphaera borealis]QOV91228.1 SRPBCC domain-containing protein [Humisphaera borealis]